MSVRASSSKCPFFCLSLGVLLYSAIFVKAWNIIGSPNYGLSYAALLNLSTASLNSLFWHLMIPSSNTMLYSLAGSRRKPHLPNCFRSLRADAYLFMQKWPYALKEYNKDLIISFKCYFLPSTFSNSIPRLYFFFIMKVAPSTKIFNFSITFISMSNEEPRSKV